MAMEINSYTEYATAVGYVVYTGRINKSTGICSVCHQARNNTERTQCFIPEYGAGGCFEENVCPECKKKIASGDYNMKVKNI